jgi:hypothetical protein
MRRAVGIALVVVAAFFLAATSLVDAAFAAPTQAAAITGVDPLLAFDAAGNPEFSANTTAADGVDNHPAASYSVCPPGGSCTPAPAPQGYVDLGPEPNGTQFIAAAGPFSVTATWQGTIRALTVPRLDGTARVGDGVIGGIAAWTGGWGYETDEYTIEACKTNMLGGCKSITGNQLGCGGPDGAVIPLWAQGEYLFSFDARRPLGEVCAGVGLLAPQDAALWKPGATVAVSKPYGPVKPAILCTRLHATLQLTDDGPQVELTDVGSGCELGGFGTVTLYRGARTLAVQYRDTYGGLGSPPPVILTNQQHAWIRVVKDGCPRSANAVVADRLVLMLPHGAGVYRLRLPRTSDPVDVLAQCAGAPSSAVNQVQVGPVSAAQSAHG